MVSDDERGLIFLSCKKVKFLFLVHEQKMIEIRGFDGSLIEAGGKIYR